MTEQQIEFLTDVAVKVSGMTDSAEKMALHMTNREDLQQYAFECKESGYNVYETARLVVKEFC